MSSGKFNLRIPPALHDQLVEQAGQQGVSLNQLCSTLLAGSIGFSMEASADRLIALRDVRNALHAIQSGPHQAPSARRDLKRTAQAVMSRLGEGDVSYITAWDETSTTPKKR